MGRYGQVHENQGSTGEDSAEQHQGQEEGATVGQTTLSFHPIACGAEGSSDTEKKSYMSISMAAKRWHFGQVAQLAMRTSTSVDPLVIAEFLADKLEAELELTNAMVTGDGQLRLKAPIPKKAGPMKVKKKPGAMVMKKPCAKLMKKPCAKLTADFEGEGEEEGEEEGGEEEGGEAEADGEAAGGAETYGGAEADGDAGVDYFNLRPAHNGSWTVVVIRSKKKSQLVLVTTQMVKDAGETLRCACEKILDDLSKNHDDLLAAGDLDGLRVHARAYRAALLEAWLARSSNAQLEFCFGAFQFAWQPEAKVQAQMRCLQSQQQDDVYHLK